MKRGIIALLLWSTLSVMAQKVSISERDQAITPHKWETCYQYAERKVNEMIKKHWPKRIVGSIWLSEYWAHHYYGAIEYRNYTWQAV